MSKEEEVLNRNQQQQKEWLEIKEEMNRNNFNGYAYTDDSEVKISGKLMSQIFDLLNNHQLHSRNLQNAYQNLSAAQDAMLMEDTDVLLSYMRLHVENCKNGVAVPQKVKNVEESKKKIQPINPN